MINTIIVKLYEKKEGHDQRYEDPFNKSATDEFKDGVEVPGVLVSPVSADDVINELNLSGKRISCSLFIPKGDQHIWAGAKIEFFGHYWRVVGIPQEWIEDNVPLKWNKKVQVEYIE